MLRLPGQRQPRPVQPLLGCGGHPWNAMLWLLFMYMYFILCPPKRRQPAPFSLFWAAAVVPVTLAHAPSALAVSFPGTFHSGAAVIHEM